AGSRSAVLPIPAAPRKTRALPCPARACSSRISICFRSPSRPTSMSTSYAAGAAATTLGTPRIRRPRERGRSRDLPEAIPARASDDLCRQLTNERRAIMTSVRSITRVRHMLIGACMVGAAGLAIAGTAVSSRQGAPAGLIVFTKEGGAYGDGQLFTIRPDGTGLHQITRGPTNSVNADWTPDGQSRACAHYRRDSARVSLMNADGTDVRAVTPDGFQDAPSFAPDGKARVY